MGPEGCGPKEEQCTGIAELGERVEALETALHTATRGLVEAQTLQQRGIEGMEASLSGRLQRLEERDAPETVETLVGMVLAALQQDGRTDEAWRATPLATHGDIARMPGNMTPYDLQREIEDAVERVRHHTMVTFSRLATNYQMAAYCEEAGLPGAFVECGVWKGGASGLMAIASLRHGSRPRDIHLFDSFDDMCEPDESVDGDRAVNEAREWARQTGPLTGALRPMEGFYAHLGGPGSPADCLELIVDRIGYPADRVHILQGWFQDTLPAAQGIDEIALLRLDCDYYHSTKYCLEHLFDRVVSGGFVVIDDYGWYEGCRKAVDEFLATLPRRYFLNHADADCRYLIKD